MTDDLEDSITIAEMAKELGRAEHTIRQWVREDELPEDLRPSREGGRQKLVWSRSRQLEGMRRFAQERGQRKGWQHPSPSPA